MFLKITINFYKRFFQEIDTVFLYFMTVFLKNRMKVITKLKKRLFKKFYTVF